MSLNDATLSKDAPQSLLIVGMGASAGGVEALSRFFDAVPAGCGLAFVVITHTAPHHKSRLCEILARHTAMAVADATDDTLLAADHVYVMPADSSLTLAGDRLRLRPTNTTSRRHPIDAFFSSLALQAGRGAVGIVLSGTGADGTLGVQKIKEHGGLTLAQAHSDSSSQYDGMPASAVNTGMIDTVLPVEDMGRHLCEHAKHVATLPRGDQVRIHHEPADQEQHIREICAILRECVGHDFEGYKRKTFLRRVQRRMAAQQLHAIGQYVQRLRGDPAEAGLLFADLLIGVTSFFRDSDAFDAIATRVMPLLFERAAAPQTVRVWVPGCATGEEAYSIAILLRERAATLPLPPQILVFATDIDDAALAIARAGRYSAAALEKMAPLFVERYFHSEEGSYVITKEVRAMCVFSAHSVTRDPPFSRMDFISCRNLLIYFDGELQDDVLPLFHYALNPGGVLFLGTADKVLRFSDFFSPVDKKHRIFQKRSTASSPPRLPTWNSRLRRAVHPQLVKDSGMNKGQHLQRQVDEMIREHFAPSHLVVEADGSIVHYSSRSARYLEPQLGAPNRQLLTRARKGLRLELRAALHEAVAQHTAVVRERVDVDMEDGMQPVRLVIEPLPKEGQEPLFLVVFTEMDRPPLQVDDSPERSSSDVKTLHLELKQTRDHLQSAIEEYETTLEELKSGNEELVSVNEELQSSNEELQTSTEELHSINEELHTVNSELADKIDELHGANADLNNLFESTQVATVFLSQHLLIRNYTPAIAGIFNLIPSDRGRPITDIAHQVDDLDLRADLIQVLETREPVERPVRLRDRSTFHLMRILPYRTVADEIDGVLVTFVNVTAVVVAEEQQRLLVAELNHRVRNMLQVVIGLANQTVHRSADLKEFEKAFMGRMQALARAYQLLSRDGWHNVPLKELLRSQLSPFAAEGRYSADGATVVLTANAALALGLIIYELGTNATKYGALSNDHGHIDVNWELMEADKEFILRWAERDGPPVTPPTHRGFGSELVQRQLRYELSGKVTMDFAPQGLTVVLALPPDQIVLSATP